MHRERAPRQNIGPFRVHDAFMEVALLDLQSRLARTLVTVTVVGSRNGGPSSSSSSSLQIQWPRAPDGNRPHPLHLPNSTPNLRRLHALSRQHPPVLTTLNKYQTMPTVSSSGL